MSVLRDLTRRYFFRKIAYKMLVCKPIINNPIYNLIYGKLIKSHIKKIEKGFPPALLLEPTNLCNANCVFCCRDITKRKLGTMSMDLYKKIIDQSRTMGIEGLTLTGFGEPFLDKRLIEKIKYAKEKGIKVIRIFTNGSLIDDDMAEKIINCDFEDLLFSIDTSNPEEYNKTRLKLDFNQVVENLINLKNKRDKAGKKSPRILISATVLDTSLREVKKIFKYFKGKSDGVITYPLHNWSGEKDIADTVLDGRKITGWPCPYLWGFIYARWDGEVSICCVDHDSRISLGNLNKQTIEEIWNGEILQNLRKDHLNGEKNKIITCKNCTIYPNWWADLR